MTELTIQPLVGTDVEGLNQAYAIYHDAIELSEQRTEAVFKALADRPDYRFLVALRGTAMAGVAVSYIPRQDDFWLFEYAAVAPGERGTGIGARLFMASRLTAGLGRVGLIEVDVDTGTLEQAQRLVFYARLGCRRLRGLDYLLPLETFGEPPPMCLLALAPPDLTSIGVDTIERWLRSIYQDVYGRQLDDRRLARMIDPLPDDVTLEAL